MTAKKQPPTTKPSPPLLIPVKFMQFREPQRLPGSQSASGLTSHTGPGSKTRHTIDWVPQQGQFRIVFHPPNKETQARWIFPNCVQNYERFPKGESYCAPPNSGLPKRDQPAA
jgi:hypothetical protein